MSKCYFVARFLHTFHFMQNIRIYCQKYTVRDIHVFQRFLRAQSNKCYKCLKINNLAVTKLLLFEKMLPFEK